ncbi:MAG TPA: DUF2283 domain-containing protein [Candidatus Wunengus sp. YC63]|uniref:DUF2283 domain-containing protein n=1 Tax=unclassified Candidatus Wunengus TaxID=3367695 RepID=UPI004029DE63
MLPIRGYYGKNYLKARSLFSVYRYRYASMGLVFDSKPAPFSKSQISIIRPLQSDYSPMDYDDYLKGFEKRKRGNFMATIEIEKTLKEVNELVSHFIKMPETKMWIDYDKEADVLYISFKRPQHATDSEMLENGIILRYKGEELVGITVLNASKR